MKIRSHGVVITTNNVPRHSIDWADLTPKEQKDFDWVKNPEENAFEFIRYKGNAYAICDFMRCPDGMFPSEWEGYESQTYFSGVLIRAHLESGYASGYVMADYCTSSEEETEVTRLDERPVAFDENGKMLRPRPEPVNDLTCDICGQPVEFEEARRLRRNGFLLHMHSPKCREMAVRIGRNAEAEASYEGSN